MVLLCETDLATIDERLPPRNAALGSTRPVRDELGLTLVSNR